MKNKIALNFDYTLAHKNWGLIDEDEPFELFYEGHITKLFSPTYPKSIGMFELMVYEIGKAKKLNQFDPMIEMMHDLSREFTSRFTNLSKLFNDVDLDFKGKDKIIFLKNVIIHPDYRGQNILDELIKSIYITHYSKNSLFLLNSFPLQVIEDEFVYYNTEFFIDILDGNNNNRNVTVGEYFKLNDLPQEYDEIIDYKLFGRMQNLNFTKFGDTSYFYLKDEKDVLKLFKKGDLTTIFKK